MADKSDDRADFYDGRKQKIILQYDKSLNIGENLWRKARIKYKQSSKNKIV